MSFFNNGANIDTRSEEQKSKDYKFEEIVCSIEPVNWVEKQPSQWRKFPIFSQNGSGSCVAQTGGKMLGILYWLINKVYVHFSATHIYQQRSNKPNSGMAGVEALEIMKKGVTLEELVPSQDMTDTEMDNIEIPDYKKKVGEIFKIPNYITLPTKDIDTVASVIQKTGKGVMVWFYFNYQEWTQTPTIIDKELNLYASSTCRHSVTAVDFTLYNGKKALIIEDSWGPNAGIGGQRIITEDFFKERNWFAAYPMTFKFEEQENVIEKHSFEVDLQFGDNNPSVARLQDALKVNGVFPSNISSTGYYGAITKKSVQKFQDKYNIAHVGNSGYGRCGPKTRAKLNELYA